MGYQRLAGCLMVAMGLSVQAQKEVSLRVVEQDAERITVSFDMGDFALEEVEEGYAMVRVAGMESMAMHEGLPSLPTMSRIICLPRGTEVEAEEVAVVATEVLELGEGIRLLPWQGGAVKDREEMAPVAADKMAYGQPRYWSAGETVAVENVGVMGTVQVVRVRVSPASYHPAEGRVRLATGLKATLKVKPATKGGAARTAMERYVVVSRPEFREGLQPFVRWKRQEGYEVKEVYADTATCDSVKAAIDGLWGNDEERWPRYVLLVGDVRQLHAFQGTTAPADLLPTITDLYYAEHTGDFLPDAMVGRWPVNDTAELRSVVEKTLRYEQGRDMDTAWLKRMLLVAGYERYNPAPTTTNGQVNYVAREAKLMMPQIDTLCWHNPGSQYRRDEILNELGQGAALLNYTAHCTTGGWTSPSVTFATIDTIAAKQPMLYVNNCCESNHFAGNCFGEQLLRKPVGGAIGVIGATNSTLWNEDYYWSVGPKYPFSTQPDYDAQRLGAFDQWLGRAGGVATVGELMIAGNLAVSAFGSPYEKYYWEIYCLLGDPSLMPYVGVPQMLEVAADEEIRVGATEMVVRGTAGAKVGVMQGDSMLAVGVVPSSGLLRLTLKQSVDTGALLLTATAAGHWPKVDTVMPTAIARGIGLHHVQVADSSIAFDIVNHGLVDLSGVVVAWQQDSIDYGGGAEVSIAAARVEHLEAGVRQRIVMPSRLVAIGQKPIVKGRLVAANTAELCHIEVEYPIAVDYPTVQIQIMDTDSGLVDQLAKGSTYLLHTLVGGAYDSLRVSIDGAWSSSVSPMAEDWIPFAVGAEARSVAVVADLFGGHWRQQKVGYFIVDGGGDGFEKGTACFPWQGGGTMAWVVDSSMSHSGGKSMRSGAIDYRQTSVLKLEVDLPQSGTVGFYAKTSCEEMYDMLTFSIDGVAYKRAWGEMDWKHYSVEVAQGKHVLKWSYVKDESNTEGEDCVWIDDVELPLAAWDAVYGCEGSGGVGIDTTERMGGIRVYPNPTKGMVNIDLGGEAGEGLLRILDMYGRHIVEQKIGGRRTLQVDVRGMAQGVYLIAVEQRGGCVVRKLIINP